MNLENLKKAEQDFLEQYPEGFNSPEMIAIAKKHRVDKMTALTRESFAESNFNNEKEITQNMVKVISRASMVSMFEKPRFRDFEKTLAGHEREMMAEALYEQLHGNQKLGFEMMLSLLQSGKIAKWTLISIIPLYFKPNKDIFVKPMTTKGIIKFLQLDIEYKPLPSWAFYEQYRSIINELKTKVDPSLSPNNAAFSGFLMMSI